MPSFVPFLPGSCPRQMMCAPNPPAGDVSAYVPVNQPSAFSASSSWVAPRSSMSMNTRSSPSASISPIPATPRLSALNRAIATPNVAQVVGSSDFANIPVIGLIGGLVTPLKRAEYFQQTHCGNTLSSLGIPSGFSAALARAVRAGMSLIVSVPIGISRKVAARAGTIRLLRSGFVLCPAPGERVFPISRAFSFPGRQSIAAP